MNGLLELADRVEAANGPDRELDRLVALVMRNGKTGAFSTAEAWLKAAERENWNLPYVTRSLDAAMTLVPDAGFGSIIGGVFLDGRQGFVAVVTKPTRAEAEAGTMALALTAAALRARAASSPSSPSKG
ncbi:MAG TPA: hypothetical protein VF614_15085 [Chthoniobacteraceae bacterium]|jgi:hypothetical protein